MHSGKGFNHKPGKMAIVITKTTETKQNYTTVQHKTTQELEVDIPRSVDDLYLVLAQAKVLVKLQDRAKLEFQYLVSKNKK
jgi:hypothetical protein